VAPHHRDQMGLLVRDGPMPIDPTTASNGKEPLRPSAGGGDGLVVSPIWPIAAEIDETRLVGMER
jgi:hypothetical protein